MSLEDRIRGLQLEDRVHASVEEVLGELRGRIGTDLQHIVGELVKAAAEEREEAIVSVRRSAFDEGSQNGLRLAAEADLRLNAAVDQAVTAARDQAVQSVEQQVREARAAGEAAHEQALAEARARADEARDRLAQATRRYERDSAAVSFGRLVSAFRALDRATSLTETLDALAAASAREAARTAVLVVRNDRLLGWKLKGFGDRDSQPKSVDVGLNEGGVLGLALTSNRAVATRDGGSAARGPAFAGLDSTNVATAAPVVVGGRTVAVVYADDRSVKEDGSSSGSGWLEVIELLARHAARCLEALTVQRTTAAPPPRFWVPPPSAGQGPFPATTRPGRLPGASTA
jgi:hypothetical protein